jgi:hypothetical protein
MFGHTAPVAGDRREYQRLRLAKPILGQIDDQSALILDIGIAGAFLEHYGTASPGDRFQVLFRWHGEDIAYLSEVARSTVIRTPGGDGKSMVSHTGVRFIKPVGLSEERLHDLMATFVGRILAAQRANASGQRGESSEGETILARMGEARRLRTRTWVTYRMKGNAWWRFPTDVPEQPPDGFTVAASEDEEELETLCRAYETADEEGRNLIRLVAELSVISVRKS